MKLLLDTHAFLWYITNNPKLPQYAFDAIRDKSNEAYLSVADRLDARDAPGLCPYTAQSNACLPDAGPIHLERNGG